MTRPLTILGASVRAAAYSAHTAGFTPWCADLFADVDLQSIAACDRVENYPYGLVEHLARSPKGPWMYTGALENYPDLIDELARVRPLYGNSRSVLARARDPLVWSRALAEAGVPAPRVSLSYEDLPRDGSWMRKPFRSGNGPGVRIWTAQAARQVAEGAESHRWYYQERIKGVPISAVYVASGESAALLGLTEQLLGGDWREALGAVRSGDGAGEQRPDAELGESPFRYSGSIGPVVVDQGVHRDLMRLGETLARACGLVGLFGVDCILNSQAVWPVEINPRYTASIEVLERASAQRTGARRAHRLLSIECHATACLLRQTPASLGQSGEVISGKLIYYAPRNCRFSSATARWVAEQNLSRARPAVADIPAAGTMIRGADPVLTLFADGRSARSVVDQLSEAAKSLETLLAYD